MLELPELCDTCLGGLHTGSEICPKERCMLWAVMLREGFVALCSRSISANPTNRSSAVGLDVRSMYLLTCVPDKPI